MLIFRRRVEAVIACTITGFLFSFVMVWGGTWARGDTLHDALRLIENQSRPLHMYEVSQDLIPSGWIGSELAKPICERSMDQMYRADSYSEPLGWRDTEVGKSAFLCSMRRYRSIDPDKGWEFRYPIRPTPWWIPSDPPSDALDGNDYFIFAAIGWPLPAWRADFREPDAGHYVIDRGIPLLSLPALLTEDHPGGRPERAVLPTVPLWRGIIVNTAFFAVFAWFLRIAQKRLVGELRGRRGRCPACGYTLDGLDRCPECGCRVTFHTRVLRVQ